MCRDSVDRFAGASIVLRRVADVGRSTGKKSASPVKLLVENGPCCVGRMPREVRRAAGEHSNSTSLGLFDHGKRVSFCLSFVRSFFDSVERAVARSRACVLPILIFVSFCGTRRGGRSVRRPVSVSRFGLPGSDCRIGSDRRGQCSASVVSRAG